MTRANVTKILDLQLADLNRRLEERHLSCVLTDAAKEYVVAHAYDPVYGARPLKRYIQGTIETMLARRIIAAEPAPGTRLTVDVVGGELTLAA